MPNNAISIVLMKKIYFPRVANMASPQFIVFTTISTYFEQGAKLACGHKSSINSHMLETNTRETGSVATLFNCSL